ncbi:glycosyltransferase family 4 protein [Candidatus Dojkabacteria bacterium]|nr:glycosyltransferase family 4 protein [Candidatus Dojkabacteria bacterium]
MKIAILNKYQESVNRGGETFVRELSKRLQKNHQVDVISKIDYLKLIKGKYDLVIPTNGRAQAFLTRIVTWITGAKMVISGQSGVGFDDRLNLYSMPDAFVALSSYALEKSKRRNPFVKSIYIPNGVDLDLFVVKPKHKSQNLKTVISVGAFTEQKRHELVINAVSKLKDVKLIIVGGGGDKKQDLTLIGENLLGKDRFEIIETTNDKMPEIYSRANIFTLASKTYESFGIVLVEAMACGLPVVATDDPIRREIVGDAGLFVDPTDTSTYTKSIEIALNTNWGEKPRKQAEKFDWDNIAKQYEELFNSL